VLDDATLHRALADLRSRGVRIGVSTSGQGQADTIRRALAIVVDGEPLFTSIQSTWNVLEPSAGPALAEAAEAGARVIVKEAVANGRLAPGGGDDTPGPRRAAAMAAELGVGVDQLATAAALAQPWAWRVLSGAVSPDQLHSNIRATCLTLPADVLAELETLAEHPGPYWASRARRPWS
jgi:aryl-alcohol dehydrogenase-like predicted oxidoreductase